MLRYSHDEILNPNLEMRNSNQQNEGAQPMLACFEALEQAWFRSLRFETFGFVSHFEIRISDFSSRRLWQNRARCFKPLPAGRFVC